MTALICDYSCLPIDYSFWPVVVAIARPMHVMGRDMKDKGNRHGAVGKSSSE